MLVRRRKVHLISWVALLCICSMIIAGCSASSKNSPGGFDAASRMEPGESDRMGNEAQYSKDEQEQSGQEDLAEANPRYVIRKGSLTLTVLNTREAVETIEQMTADSGGIVSESRIYEFREGQYAAELTLRIPEVRFDSFIARLQDLGEAANVHKNSEDVTLPYLDMETRIKNLKAEEERLREILAKAKTVEEILQVEREFSRVRGEIELKTMSFTHLQDQVSLSTIQLSIREEVIDTQTISQKPFENIGKRMKEAFFRSINFISSATAFILVALTTLLPVLAIIALFVLLIFWLIRVNRRKKESIPPGGQPPAMP